MKKLNSKTIEIKDKLESQKLIKVAVFDQNKNKTNPHKHNGYLELVFLYEASGKHVIDGREATVNSPCILIIRKDNVHHWDLKNPVKGHVVLLKKLFVEQSLDFEISRLVEEIINYDTIYLNDLVGIDKILEVLAIDEDKISQEGLFKSILAKALSFTPQLKPFIAKQNHLYLSFCELLNNDAKVINHVAHYASLLNTSPQNLNAACKKYVKLTASEILAAHIIKEAKRLLIYTTKSISEIAFDLGFSDKSNFSKYFKRYTGLTPSEFKNMEIKTLFPQTHS